VNVCLQFEVNLFCMLHVETGRGLMALKHLKPGDIIVSIPENLLITSQSVLSSSVGQVIRRFVTKHSL